MFLAVEIKGLLIGQSIAPEVRHDIIDFLEAKLEVKSVLNLITLQLGEQIMVAVKPRMENAETVDELIQNINRCEAALKKYNPAIQWSFFEPEVID